MSVSAALILVNIWVSAAVLLPAVVVLVIRERGSRRRDRSCRRVAHLLQSFLDEEVDLSTVMRIEDHLEQCRRCGMEADVYWEIKEALARSTPAVPELTLRRLHHFGEELGARVGGQPQGTGT